MTEKLRTLTGFKNFCCCCLQAEVTLREQHFEEGYSDINCIKFIDIAEELFPDIQYKHGYSYKLCHKCINMLLNAYLLKKKLLKSQRIYNKYAHMLKDDAAEGRTELYKDVGTSSDLNAVIKSSYNSKIRNKTFKDFSPTLHFQQKNIHNNLTDEKLYPVINIIEDEEENAKKDNDCILVQQGKVETQTKNSKKGPKLSKRNARQLETQPKQWLPQHKSFSCKYCSKTFGVKLSLLRHQSIHASKKYNCNLCNVTFGSHEDMYLHKKKLHPVSASCSVTSSNVEKPYNVQPQEQDRPTPPLRTLPKVNTYRLKAFMCRHCSQLFKDYKLFKNHVRSHVNRTAYLCKFCSKRFNLASMLKAHEKLHALAEKYKCCYCSCVFTNSTDLTDHQVVHECIQAPKRKSQNMVLKITSNVLGPATGHRNANESAAEKDKKESQIDINSHDRSQNVGNDLTQMLKKNYENLKLKMTRIDTRIKSEGEAVKIDDSDDDCVFVSDNLQFEEVKIENHTFI